jgi:arylsulfatase A
VRAALEESGRADNCLVVFTSDNGPWLVFKEQGGSAGLLREGKGCTFEGGMREPMIAWGPGLVQAGVVCHELGSTLDLLPTCASLAGASLAADRTLDGYDLSETLASAKPSPRQEMYFYRGSELMAVRQGQWKAHFFTELAYVPGGRKKHDTPLLYDLEIDPGEQYEVSKDHPDVTAELTTLARKHRASFTQAPTQLESRIGK